MTLAAGTKLGRYEIRSKIGAGGMGEVYLAQDTKLDRKVALKILPAEVAAHPDRMKRFVQEAKVASALNHPNIITIHEIDQADSGYFIATEFIDGETLRERTRKAPLKLGEVLDVAVQSASALSAAHAAGIVHRDIKPENIMLRHDGIVKVLDFGLAKLTERLPSESIDPEAPTRAFINTEPGIVMGTAIYMSPEQARGMPVDARTDIFSLGVVLYEMVAGCLPFAGSTLSEVMASILSEKEPQPLARYSREVPAELERIVSKAWRKNRDERYQTIKDLLLDLKSLKQELEFSAKLERSVPPKSQSAAETGEPAEAETVVESAARPTVSERVKPRVSRSKPINSIAILPLANASTDPNMEYLSDGITESIINSLSYLPKLRVMARSTVFRYKGRDADPQAVGRDLNVHAVLTGRVLHREERLVIKVELVNVADGSQLWGEQYNRKLVDIFAIEEEIAREISEKLRLKLSSREQKRLVKRHTENAEAYQAYLKGLYYWNKGLAPGYEKSRDYFQQAIDLDPSYALAYSGLALYYSFAAANGLLPPDENSPKAEEAANKALALDETLAESYNPLAAVKLYYYRDWPAAERYFRRGIELDPNFAEIHNHYALCLYLFGRNDEALTEIQRAVELEPLTLRFSYFRGRILFVIRQYDRAIDQYRKTLELDQNFALAHEWLGDAYEQKGMPREAIAEWGRALTLSGEGEQGSILERTYAASGFETAVRALAQKKLERLNEKTGRGEYVPASEYVMAYMRLGDKERVFGWLAKAVEERNRFALDFKVNPIFDSLRSDPRFADLVRRTGLPQ